MADVLNEAMNAATEGRHKMLLRCVKRGDGCILHPTDRGSDRTSRTRLDFGGIAGGGGKDFRGSAPEV